jgi:hypothetical protein
MDASVYRGITTLKRQVSRSSCSDGCSYTAQIYSFPQPFRMHQSLVLLLSLTGPELAAADANCSPLHFVYAHATTEPPQGIKEATTAEEFQEAAAKVCSRGYGAAGANLRSNLTSLKASTHIEGITAFPVPYPVGHPCHLPDSN